MDGAPPPPRVTSRLLLERLGDDLDGDRTYFAVWHDACSDQFVPWSLSPGGHYESAQYDTLVRCQEDTRRPGGFGVRTARSLRLTEDGQLLFVAGDGDELARYAPLPDVEPPS